MADGVAVTPGTGVTIATDDAGGTGHVQLVKLAISTDGSATHLTADNTDGLLVNLGSNNDVTITSGTVTANHPTTGIANGRKVTVSAGTAVALASSTSAKWVVITAETDNTGYVVVGGSGVIAALATRQGVPLMAGDSVALPIDNLADVYIDSLVSGDGVTFTYGTGA